MTDWSVGDLAVCVDASAWIAGGLAPAYLSEGATYTVSAVIPATTWEGGYYGRGLVLRGCPAPRNPNRDWPEARFRKIHPDEHEACEEEFQTLLKRLNPEAPIPLYFPKVRA